MGCRVRPHRFHVLLGPGLRQDIQRPTYGADFHADGEDGVGAGRVLVHEGGTHCPVSPARLHEPLALAHAVHGVQGQPLHVRPFFRVLLQLQTGTTQNGLEREAPRLQETIWKLEGYASSARGEIKLQQQKDGVFLKEE